MNIIYTVRKIKDTFVIVNGKTYPKNDPEWEVITSENTRMCICDDEYKANAIRDALTEFVKTFV